MIALTAITRRLRTNRNASILISLPSLAPDPTNTPYRVEKAMGSEIQTGTLLSRFNAGENWMISATFKAASSSALWPELS